MVRIRGGLNARDADAIAAGFDPPCTYRCTPRMPGVGVPEGGPSSALCVDAAQLQRFFQHREQAPEFAGHQHEARVEFRAQVLAFG